MMKLKFYAKNTIKNVVRRLTLGKRADGDETRWRPPSTLLILLILCGALIFFIDVFQLQSFKIPSATISLPQPRFIGFSKDNLKGFLIKTEGCRIPEMDAFDSEIMQFIFNENSVVCNNEIPALIESNLTHLYLLDTTLSAYGITDIGALKCCYSTFRRQIPTGIESDNKRTFSKYCVLFNHSCTINNEFVRVVCSYNGSDIYKDYFSFVPITPEKKSDPVTNHKTQKLNVLIVGVDAVSRLNLHRQMPKTVQILEDMNAVELMGYNKVADNTFPNLIPVLTGLHEVELTKKCWTTTGSRFDNCPFIWKNFSKRGYATAFGEDSAWMGIFNYLKKGFKKQPTDYFWGPFNLAMEDEIGNEHDINVFQCVGARMVHKTLLEYMDKFTRTMHINDISYFAFFWGASLSHDYLNKPKLGDNDYAKFLHNLRSTGVLNDTVLIFMSDHGIRWGEIRSTYQGRMEERLPFLFVTLPNKYKELYYQTYMNLKKNARRLTTPFDLHETLKDLLDPYSLTREALNTRIQRRRKQRGYSLFEPILTNRTCEDAGIASHWCTCQQSTGIDKNDTTVVEAAEFTVNHINKMLDGYAGCANLSLAEVFNARVHNLREHGLVGHNNTRDYTIAFRTKPGGGSFEVTVRQYLETQSNTYYFTVIGTISRINLYGRQSLCVTDFHLKLYCYCKT